MRRLVLPVLVTLSFIACGGVDDPPLGGPYGGSTDPTDPNSNGDNGNNNNNNPGDDSGTQQQQQDSGTTQQKDSGTTQQKDSGGQQQQDSGGQQQQDSGGQQQQTVTWTTVFNNYLAGSTKGRCSACHSQGSSKSSLYSWLSSKGYISGTSSALVDSNQSCLSWYGGNMPTNGPSSWSQAVTDMNAWAAAGAQNN